MGQCQQLTEAEGGVFRAAATENDHLSDTAVMQTIPSMVGDIGMPHPSAEQEDACDIDRDVAVADEHSRRMMGGHR